MAATNNNEESVIRAVIDAWANAMRAKDAEGVASQYSSDNVKFILAPPLQYTKDHPFDKKSLQQWFSSFQGRIDYENRDLQIAARNDGQGRKVDLWFRETLVGFRKIDGRWKITHEHSSVPFYMDGSFKAAIDLKP